MRLRLFLRLLSIFSILAAILVLLKHFISTPKHRKLDIDNITKDVLENPENIEIPNNIQTPKDIEIPKNIEILQKNISRKNHEIAVVVVACYRLSVTTCLDSLQQAYGFDTHPFDYFISHGCNSAALKSAVQKYEKFTHLDISLDPAIRNGYEKISQHFVNFLTEIFEKRGYEKIIVIEDDLDVCRVFFILAADFLDYFAKMHILLNLDPTVLCISAWNDNGYQIYAHDPYKFQRTDFFPGLGWMITHKLWDEIKKGWPRRYWDEYFRDPMISKSRTCVYPEISRVQNFGRSGVSAPFFYSQYVQPIKKNKFKVNYDNVDLDVLHIDMYQQLFFDVFKKAQNMNLETYNNISLHLEPPIYKLSYDDRDQYQLLCKYFGITYATRYDIPRSSFRKINILHKKDHYVFLYPLNDDIFLDES